MNKNRPQVIDKNFSLNSRLNRLGIHHITVEPNQRTSYPHAESHEEEFFYILKSCHQINHKITS